MKTGLKTAVAMAAGLLVCGCATPGQDLRGVRQARYRPNENRLIQTVQAAVPATPATAVPVASPPAAVAESARSTVAAAPVKTPTVMAAERSKPAEAPPVSSRDPRPARPPVAAPAAPSPGKEDRSRLFRPGDRVQIHLRAGPEKEDFISVVDDNGGLNFTYIGNIVVAGLSKSVAEQLVEKTYVDQGYYKQITVILVPPEVEFAVQGEVLKPGSYPLSRDMTLSQALARGGRFTEYADPTKVQLIRGDETIVVNVKKMKPGKEGDIFVKPGDVILVPRTWH